MLPQEDREFQELLEKQEANPKVIQPISMDELNPPEQKWDWRISATIGLMFILLMILTIFTHKILNPPREIETIPKASP